MGTEGSQRGEYIGMTVAGAELGSWGDGDPLGIVGHHGRS